MEVTGVGKDPSPQSTNSAIRETVSVQLPLALMDWFKAAGLGVTVIEQTGPCATKKAADANQNNASAKARLRYFAQQLNICQT